MLKDKEGRSHFEKGHEDSLQFYHIHHNFPEVDERFISATDVLEKTNREIKHRSRVVGVFPSVSSYLRLIASYLVEYTEDWANDYAHIKPERFRQVLESS